MIITAACKLQIKENEVILCGVRHSDIYKQMKSMGFKPDDFEEIEQGFMTHKNEFLNRRDAYIHATDCGQLCERLRIEKNAIAEGYDRIPQLISEDLW